MLCDGERERAREAAGKANILIQRHSRFSERVSVMVMLIAAVSFLPRTEAPYRARVRNHPNFMKLLPFRVWATELGGGDVRVLHIE